MTQEDKSMGSLFMGSRNDNPLRLISFPVLGNSNRIKRSTEFIEPSRVYRST